MAKTKDPTWIPFTEYKGHLSEETYQDVWNGTYVIPESPMRATDCNLVVKPLQEKTRIPGFQIVGTPDFSKDREIDAVVLSSGPGYRVRGGAIPTYFDGQRVLNQTKRGDIVHFLERAGMPFYFKDELYYVIQEHLVYFVVEP